MGQQSSDDQPLWQKKCDSGACFEYAVRDDLIMIRSSSHPETVVSFTPEEWHVFIASAKNGLFDKLGGAA